MWLGIDIGTLSLKAQLLSRDGDTLGEGRAAYDVRAPNENWSESDPAAWWDAAVAAVHDAAGERGKEVRGVGLSGQMHGVVLTREDTTPLRPAVLWSDGRSAAQLDAYRKLPQTQRDALANPLVAGMAGPTLLWLREHEPEAYVEARWALQPKDWLRLRLTGAAASEPSDASGTLLYDVAQDCWATELLEALGLRPELLPPLRRSAEEAGTLSPKAAEALGLAPHLPVATGAADTAAAILGSGLSGGEAQLTVGSGAQLVALTGEPRGAPGRGVHLFRAAKEGWYKMAALQNAGLALEWARTLLGLSWEEMYGAFERTPPGAEGLTFLPYLTGERTPHLNPDARGGWLLASRRHGKEHFARAALEGVAFSIKDGFSALREAGTDVEQLRLAGGGTTEAQWRQLLADVLGVPLAPVTLPDASVRGAARLAALSQGEDLPLKVTKDALIKPNEQPGLGEAYNRFKELYERVFESSVGESARGVLR